MMLGMQPDYLHSVMWVQYVLPFEGYIPPHKGGDDLDYIECFSLNFPC